MSTLLRNVAVAYLENVQAERRFDLPLAALLWAIGFEDVHFTHGQVEFGKDFIAKRLEDSGWVQYSFQSKAGDISQSHWRNDIHGQMLESVLTSLSHPSFDTSLKHRSVLVTTGRLIGNAALGLQELNRRIKEQFKAEPIDVWDRAILAELIAEKAIGSIHPSTEKGIATFGRFFLTYGNALEGRVTAREIENYSRAWILKGSNATQQVGLAFIESELLSSACIQAKLPYEAIICRTAAVRSLLFSLYGRVPSNDAQELMELHSHAISSLTNSCWSYVESVIAQWNENKRDLATLIGGPGIIVTYLVHCSRILEIAGILYFLADEELSGRVANLIRDFVLCEPGCAHPLSDRYAISLVPSCLALFHSGQSYVARRLIEDAVLWVCDRYEDGYGLASLDNTAQEEVDFLLGGSADGERRAMSFAATVLADLTAFSGDSNLYEDVINDFKAVGIAHEYYQIADTDNQFLVEGADIVQYPNIEYLDVYTAFGRREFGEHIAAEPASLKVATHTGFVSHLAVSLLLRDRYFPTLWPDICTGRDNSLTT